MIWLLIFFLNINYIITFNVSKKSTTFTLFQWNTLNNKLSYKEAFPYVSEKYLKWEYRQPLIKKIIDENKADIICLEEIGNYDINFKSEILDKCNIKYDSIFEIKPIKIMGNLIGVNKELFSIEKYDNVVLNDLEGNPTGQNMIAALINDKKTNNKFMVIVVHLKSKANSENIRIGQVEHLMKYIENNHLGKYPIFILGDFNAEPNYESIKKLLENKNINVKSLFDLDKLDFTTIKKRDSLYRRIIDFIFFIPKNKDNKDKEINIINVERGNPIIDEKIGLPNDIFPSDHLFLKTKIELNFL